MHRALISLLDASLLGAAIPNPPAEAVPGLEGFERIIAGSKWVAGIICLLCLMAVGVMLTMKANDRGGRSSGADAVFMVLVGAMIVSGSASILGFVM